MIVITTPTGRIGRQVTDRLLAAEQPVRLIARDPARLPAMVRHRAAELVQGTHQDVDLLRRAISGATSVLLVVPPDPSAASVERRYLDFARAAAHAAEEAAIGKVVYVSSLGHHIRTGGGHLSAAVAADEQLMRIRSDIRVLRMPFFMENLLTQIHPIRSRGTFSLPNLADRELATVAVRDVAAAATDLLVDDSWTERADIPIVGPDRLSPNEMAQVMSDVIGQQIRFQQLTGEEYATRLRDRGMSAAWAQGLADMAAQQNEGAYDGIRQQTAPAATTFRTWCEEVLRPEVVPVNSGGRC